MTAGLLQMTWGGKGSEIEEENSFIDAHLCWGSAKVFNKIGLPLQFLVGKKNCSYLFQTAHHYSLDRQFPHGGEKIFPNKNILCPDIVSSKDDNFSADTFVRPPSPILAELQVSTHIYITFFSKRSVNSGESLLHTARPTEGWEGKCVRQKHPCTFQTLKWIRIPFCFKTLLVYAVIVSVILS